MLVTCEHAGNRVPARYARQLDGAEEALRSHRGWDPGALPLARTLASALGAPLRYTLTTRLLVDVNRPAGSAALFSEFSRHLPAEARRDLLRAYHGRHRGRVLAVLEPWIRSGAHALHIGVHTFTPKLDDVPRTVDVGVLFDPARRPEARIAGRLLRALGDLLPDLRIRANEPYLGIDEGLTGELRERFPPEAYVGIELEVSQALAAGGAATRDRAAHALCEAIRRAAPEQRSNDGPRG